MDQTDAAVYAGVIAAPVSVVVLRALAGWSLWVALPIGAVGGFFGTAIAVYLLIELIGKRAEGRDDANRK
jgi:hypothetical protein